MSGQGVEPSDDDDTFAEERDIEWIEDERGDWLYHKLKDEEMDYD